MKKLRLKAEPNQRHLIRLRRTLDEIDAGLRATMRALIQGEKPWPLFIQGPPGTGKTCASLCLLDHTPEPAFYKTASELADEALDASKGLLEWYQVGVGGTINASKYWEMLGRAELVVLDEVGMRDRVNDWPYECVKKLLDKRHGLPLVVISNVSLKQIGKLYDDRIASRIAAGTSVALLGKDRRLRG